MFPLFKKDGLIISYFTHQATLMFLIFCIKPYLTQKGSSKLSHVIDNTYWISLFGCVIIHFIDFYYPEGWIPFFGKRYPDIILYMYAMYSFAHFLAAWIYLHFMQFSILLKSKQKTA